MHFPNVSFFHLLHLCSCLYVLCFGQESVLFNMVVSVSYYVRIQYKRIKLWASRLLKSGKWKDKNRLQQRLVSHYLKAQIKSNVYPISLQFHGLFQSDQSPSPALYPQTFQKKKCSNGQQTGMRLGCAILLMFLTCVKRTLLHLEFMSIISSITLVGHDHLPRI